MNQTGSNGKDYVIHLAPLPKEEFEKTAVNYNDVQSYISNHALNVTRMLPAGLNVLGLFVKDSIDIFKNAQLLAMIKLWIGSIRR